jgi:hypothetical protein
MTTPAPAPQSIPDKIVPGRSCDFCMAPATSLIMANPVTHACDRHGLRAACIGYRVVRLDKEPEKS